MKYLYQLDNTPQAQRLYKEIVIVVKIYNINMNFIKSSIDPRVYKKQPTPTKEAKKIKYATLSIKCEPFKKAKKRLLKNFFMFFEFKNIFLL